MRRVNLKLLKSTFSKARISPYLQANDNVDAILARYHANILLCAALMPTLHYLEICLRNRMDQMLKRYFAQNWLKRPPVGLALAERDLVKIQEVICRIRERKRRVPTHDDIMAGLSLGFWCSFFYRRYDPIIWHRREAMKIIFPHLARENRNRLYIETKVFKIKNLRNRIAHHEPIWHNKAAILEVYGMSVELINAMSHDAFHMLQQIDHFPEICKALFADKKDGEE